MGTTALRTAATGQPAAEETPNDRLHKFKSQIDGVKGELSAMLGKRASVDQFVGAAWASVLNNPDLVAADRASFITALRQAANDGLLPDGREAVLNVYNTNAAKRGEPARWVKKVQYLPMVGGLVKKLYEGGEVVNLDAACVFERDEFSFRRGDDPKIEHVPYLGDDDPGPIVAGYVIATLRTGQVKREVVPRRDIMKMMEQSKSKDSDSGPWKKWPDQMTIKSAIHRAYKQLPRSPAMDRVVQHDHEAMTIDGHFTERREQSAPPALNFEPTPSADFLSGVGDAVPVPAPTDAPKVVIHDETVPYAVLRDRIEKAEAVDVLELIEYPHLPEDQRKELDKAKTDRLIDLRQAEIKK
jgi:recombination protein RecT